MIMSDNVTITVRVRPHARRTRVIGAMSDGSLKIDVAATAEGGRANAELMRFLAKHYGVENDHVEILSGLTSRKKVVRITVQAAH